MPNAISNAIDYAKFRSRSHDAVIRVYNEAGNVIETHELGMTFGAVRAANEPREFSVSNLAADSQIALFSMLFLGGWYFFLGVSASAVGCVRVV